MQPMPFHTTPEIIVDMEEVASVAMQLLSKGQGPSSLCPNYNHCHHPTKPNQVPLFLLKPFTIPIISTSK